MTHTYLARLRVAITSLLVVLAVMTALVFAHNTDSTVVDVSSVSASSVASSVFDTAVESPSPERPSSIFAAGCAVLVLMIASLVDASTQLSASELSESARERLAKAMARGGGQMLVPASTPAQLGVTRI
jgi:hypothetical protein